MPNQLLFALILVTLVTLFFTAIQLKIKAHSRLLSVLGSLAYWLYFLLQIIGNIISTVFATLIIANYIPPELEAYRFLIYLFLGLFGFHTVVKNTNISAASFLNYQEQLSAARESAIEDIIKHDATTDKEERAQITLALGDCDTDKLKGFLFHKMPKARQKRIEDEIKKAGSQGHLYLANILADEKPSEAKVLIKDHKKELARTKPKIII